MELFILRHGIAVARGTKGYKMDSERPLTKEGVEKTGRIAEAMLEMDIQFDLILSSPLVRARETAKIDAGELRADVSLTDLLAPGADPAELVSELNRKKPKSVLLVGHEPDLSRLISALISGHPDAGIELKKGGLCKLTADQLTLGRSATLNWLLTPKQLRAFL